MNHPWPPNDPERADWDRRAEAFKQRIATLETDLIAAHADVLVARERAETEATNAREAQAKLEQTFEREQKLRRIVEVYASGEQDGGRKARKAL